jgi:hypothetical protein
MAAELRTSNPEPGTEPRTGNLEPGTGNREPGTLLVSGLACPICFGANDAPMAQAMNWGVLTLLAITIVVLASFGALFVGIARRSRMAHGPAKAGPYTRRDEPANAGPYIRGDEPANAGPSDEGRVPVGAGFSRPDRSIVAPDFSPAEHRGRS